MKYVKQFLIILLISFLGEGLSYVIPVPIPAGIYGIVLLFTALVTGIIPYESVKEVGHFLVEIMPVMFIPSAVGLINSWDIVADNMIAYIIVTVITTIAVMVIAGRVTQLVLRIGGKKSA